MSEQDVWTLMFLAFSVGTLCGVIGTGLLVWLIVSGRTR